MSFDQIIDRRGTHSAKWDSMERLFGVSPDEGLAMWVADMDFRPPDCVLKALSDMQQHGVFGYYGEEQEYREAIQWWMKTRHGWEVAADHIFTTHGLVNGTALCVDAFTLPGDNIVLFTPVYHAFARVISAAGRGVLSCPLVNNDGRYEMDFDHYDTLMTGRERMVVLCSPHNPGGRVWTREELEGVAAFAKRHNLIVVSDEIHHDLVFEGHRHIPMTEVMTDNLVMMTASTKTFNIAGAHIGNVIIPDEGLRIAFSARMAGLGISPNSFGLFMATAAYSVEGVAWLEDLLAYLEANRQVFDAGINAIPGLKSMPLEATYLSWVDFSGTGMTVQEFSDRVAGIAKIAANGGRSFGEDGRDFLRFNLGTQRARVEEAVERMALAFKDLQ